MRFLIAFAAVLGLTSAGIVPPVDYNADPGDTQAAIINANVAATNYARSITEAESFLKESMIRAKNYAARREADYNTALRDNTYWRNVVALQNQAADAQSQAAALDGAAASARAAYQTAVLSPNTENARATPINHIDATLPQASSGYAAEFGLRDWE